MTSRLNKRAAAIAVAIGLSGAGAPAGAAVVGGAAEALLVPLAVWSGGGFNDPVCDDTAAWLSDFFPTLVNCVLSGYTPAFDTVMEVWVPGSIGFDDIPNIYTAANTTPTNVPTALTPADPDIAAIHWYWFDERSQELASGTIPVTADDVVQISLTEIANGQNENVPGYFVIADNAARNGDAATFSIFGNAWLTGALHFPRPDAPQQFFPPIGFGLPLVGASIPVLGMNDGDDGPLLDPFGTAIPCAQPTAQDSVKYRGGSPCAVSPLISGFRTNRSDGEVDGFAMDLALSDRDLPTIHVVWFDHNLDGGPGEQGIALDDVYPNNGGHVFASPLVNVDVYNLDELSCNTSTRLPNELNVLWIPPAYETNEDTLFPWNEPFEWANLVDLLCIVSDEDPDALQNAGFVQYRLNEYIDQDVDRAESAAFGFSLKVDGSIVSNNADPEPEALVILLESSIGHDRGTFKNF